jgi:thiamine biosynthesis lipoprotein
MRHVEPAMGTVFSIDVRARDTPQIRAAVQQVVAHLHHVDAVFSTYRPDSQVSRLARGDLALADCHPVVAEVLTLCEDAESRSGGWFSPRYGGSVDPTGLVKGWAIERASTLLDAAGAADTSVNGGGDVQVRGHRAPGEPWRIGITNPVSGGLVAVVRAAGQVAVATSGIAERGHHIYDPHTGVPAYGDLASVTVLSPGLTAADAWATAAFAMGDAARDWLEGMPDVEGLAVTRDGATWSTAGFADFVVAT